MCGLLVTLALIEEVTGVVVVHLQLAAPYPGEARAVVLEYVRVMPGSVFILDIYHAMPWSSPLPPAMGVWRRPVPPVRHGQQLLVPQM